MKFLITAVTISTETRRRRGKARTEVIDTEAPEYLGLTDPMDIENRYEDLHETTAQFEKVVDVRVLEGSRSVHHGPPARRRSVLG